MLRRTKIVATLGPATDRPGVLEKLVRAGINVARLNFSHGNPEDHIKRATDLREIATRLGRTVAILGDLQGPKIRIAKFSSREVRLKVGATFVLDAGMDLNAGDESQVGLDYPDLPNDLLVGDRLLLDDGRVVLHVTAIEGLRIITTVIVGGALSSNKGINREGGGLSAAALTEKDQRDMLTAAEINVDFLAVSFVRDADDIHLARKLAGEAGCFAHIVAKVERAEAVASDEVIDGIVKASDVIMVARGDLGVEIGDAKLMAVQKSLIEKSVTADRCVITATQMMETMIENPIPTRAEVFDVANAVLDGTDAVMLSGETAAGAYPVEAVEAMHRVIIEAERHPTAHRSEHRLHQSFESVDESVAMAAMYVANHLSGIKAIICLTETGHTPLLMSRISSLWPIYAFTPNSTAQHRAALYRGVVPVTFDTTTITPTDMNASVVAELQRRGVVENGDLLVMTKGDYVNVHGGTNTMKIVKVGDDIA
ncbi:MAG: pyruvate kinase [Pseudomonadales bacterium]